MTALINYSEVRTEAKLLPGRLRFRVPTKERDLFFFHTVQIDPGAHPGSYSVVSRVLIPVKGDRGMKLTHSHLYSAEDESERICTSATMAFAHAICRDTLILLLRSKLFGSEQLWVMPLLDVKWKRKFRIDLNLLYLKFSEKNKRSV